MRNTCISLARLLFGKEAFLQVLYTISRRKTKGQPQNCAHFFDQRGFQVQYN